MKCLHGSGLGVFSHHQFASFGKAEETNAEMKMVMRSMKNEMFMAMLLLVCVLVVCL
ncbi:hypothetical protein HanRHA438_Chr07g0325591 [Helianthus annuus]|nr:hypothetical protein HanRHA438_Chr07g0325591 [Helianthus annuus]